MVFCHCFCYFILALSKYTFGVNDIIQMMHDGECDVLKYICPEVEMSTRGLTRVLTFHIFHISYISYLHVTRVHHASFVLSHH